MKKHDIVAALILNKLEDRKGIDFAQWGEEIQDEIGKEVSDLIRVNYHKKEQPND